MTHNLKLSLLGMLTLYLSTALVGKPDSFTLSVKVDGDKEKAVRVLRDFDAYKDWNSLLEIQEGSVQEGAKLRVHIKSTINKPTTFKAKVISVEELTFSARQIIGLPVFFKATHHFIIEELTADQVCLTQTWELKGLLSFLFRKKIHEALGEFEVMNQDFKRYLEQI